MGNLLLNQIFNNSNSGTVTLSIPLFDSNTQKGSRISVKGFLTSDPSIQFRNQCGSILPDDTNINEVMNLVGSKSLAAWVSSSSAGWKSCEPITIAFDFYLLSLNKNSNIKWETASILQLATLNIGNQTLNKNMFVNVHGGYEAGNDNRGVFEANSTLLSNVQRNFLDKKEKEGTVTIQIGDQVTLSNMLLQEVTAEHSSVQVAEGVPLYIKLSTNWRMCRAPIVQDVAHIYGGI